MSLTPAGVGLLCYLDVRTYPHLRTVGVRETLHPLLPFRSRVSSPERGIDLLSPLSLSLQPCCRASGREVTQS